MTAQDYIMDKITNLRRKGYCISPESSLVYISSAFYSAVIRETSESLGIIDLNEHGLYIMGFRAFVVANDDAPDIEFTIR